MHRLLLPVSTCPLIDLCLHLMIYLKKKVFWFRRQRYARGDWETDWAVRRGGSKVWLLWFLKATFSPHALFFFPWVELKWFLLSWQNLKWQKKKDICKCKHLKIRQKFLIGYPLAMAESAWDNSYLNRKIFLFHFSYFIIGFYYRAIK